MLFLPSPSPLSLSPLLSPLPLPTPSPLSSPVSFSPLPLPSPLLSPPPRCPPLLPSPSPPFLSRPLLPSPSTLSFSPLFSSLSPLPSPLSPLFSPLPSPPPFSPSPLLVPSPSPLSSRFFPPPHPLPHSMANPAFQGGPSSHGLDVQGMLQLARQRVDEGQPSAALQLGRAIDFEVWLDDLQLFLQCDRADGLSLFVNVVPSPPDREQVGDGAVDVVRGVQTLYDAVVARYSSPATAALSRLMLPYLFPDLSAFPTVTDLITHLRTSDTRYRAALPAEFCAKNPPPMYIALYYVVVRLPDSLRVVRDHFLAVCPSTLTVDLLEKALLAAEKSIVAVGASRGDPRTPIFEGCSPPPLLPSVASAAAADLLGLESAGAASAPSGRRRSSKGKGGKGAGGAGGGGGGV
ncbi:unnamed protein product [Closterium sp. NIES-53]